MRINLFILLFLFQVSFLFPIDLVDVSRNHRHFEHINYIAENHFVPAFVDNTFQIDAYLTVYQCALSVLFVSGVSLDYQEENSYVADFKEDSKEYPYMQYIYEKGLVKGDMDGMLTCNIGEALEIFSLIFKQIDFSFEKGKDDFLTRGDFLSFLIQIDQFNKDVSRYRVEKRKREDEYVGSAVSEYILGYASALDRIELSKYSSGNKDFYDIFWKFASERDKKYQKFNEDLSLEDLDILEKRLNQALLNFYNFKYWLVIQQCNIILKEDSKNVGALSLKGSTYYMLRDFEKAKKYWEKVLYYHPDNKEVVYFLKMLRNPG